MKAPEFFSCGPGGFQGHDAGDACAKDTPHMKWILRLIIMVCALIVAAHVPVRTEYGHFCEYTGSVKEWTAWLVLVKTDELYRKSKLEVFLEEKHASELQHRWISFRDTTTFLAAGRLYACGAPGPLFDLPQSLFDQWCDAVSEDEKLKLYHLLVSGDKVAIEGKTHEMQEFILTRLGYILK